MITSAFSSQRDIKDGWEYLSCDPDEFLEPAELARAETSQWIAAIVPGTVALSRQKQNSCGVDPVDIDGEDHWFRCRFTADPQDTSLVFEGLATLADVWLNGEHVLSSENMFITHEVQATGILKTEAPLENALLIRFRSLNFALETRFPRAKWRTRLVAHRNLRYFRTTLLGRMPGIYPLVAPVGPWKAVAVKSGSPVELLSCNIQPSIQGSDGKVSFNIEIATADSAVDEANVHLGDISSDLNVIPGEGSTTLVGEAVISEVKRWWPHTHGEPCRYDLKLCLRSGDVVVAMELPAVGFRSIGLQSNQRDFGLQVNGVSVYCRGANWIPLDLTSLSSDSCKLRSALMLVKAAGMNMVRVSGITIYESDDFYELCDELGIMVWQDFMFASMDYPYADEAFRKNAMREANEVLQRLKHRPSVVVFCGSSEVEQQVVMLGLPAELAQNGWFDRDLPALCAALRPDAVYCTSSPTGGELPFYADAGVSHYFAVGGYCKSAYVAQLEPPTFATECLAFSIPPEPQTIRKCFTSNGCVEPENYSTKVPRDTGSDWDFAQVTDYYIQECFHIDPVLLRKQNFEKYLQVARLAVGETMRKVVEGWRRSQSPCQGSLIWTLRDLEPGGGWGLIDSDGIPKAPYYFLKRAWQPIAIAITDHSINGLRVHIHNDTADEVTGELIVRLMNEDGKIIQQAASVELCSPHSSIERSVDSLLGGFVDSSYAYRFGPPVFDLVHCVFQPYDADQGPVDVLFVLKTPDLLSQDRRELNWRVERVDGDGFILVVSSTSFVQYAILDLPGCFVSDNYFFLLPGVEKTIDVRVEPGIRNISGTLCTADGTSTVKMSARMQIGA